MGTVDKKLFIDAKICEITYGRPEIKIAHFVYCIMICSPLSDSRREAANVYKE